MRKNTKQSILDIIKTIYNAHDDIKKLIKKGNNESAASLIGDCQDAALSIGNTVLESEGEDFVTIGLIENYCRDLFDAYNSINDNCEYDVNEIVKLLNKDLTDIKKSIEKDITGKLEVVFMPYKASMWDSLESVWKAADKDPECDAYVVPVPYYDRNPDHSFGEFHYEGNQFPDYVPVTHYLKYDERKRKPDVIYIHNPYDDCNYVTSVDPRFYSSELKKCTEKLVYIPYFVLDEFNYKSRFKLNNIAHFIMTPGVMNSDEVIVQSENIKKAYVKVLLENYGDTSENRKKFERKILGTGSPKIEKIITLRRDDYSLPAEWKNIIYRPDGIRKKVVLYNNSIAAFLDNSEKMIKKIYNVFELFLNNFNDVVLLWRPHPLLESTIKSIRPYLWESYKNLVNQYQAGGWGIYDDSADLNRAIIISDAYYGDMSSVVQLCLANKMPVMIQNCDLLKTNESETINCPGALIDDDEIYLSAKESNVLYKINLNNFESEVVCAFDEFYEKADSFIFKTLKYGNNLYLFSQRGCKVYVYNIEERSGKLIQYYDSSIYDKVVNIEKIRSKVFVFMDVSMDVIVLDLETLKTDIIVLGENYPSLMTRTVAYDNYIFYSTRNLNDTNNVLFILDVDKHFVDAYTIDLKYITCIEVNFNIVYILGIDNNDNSVIAVYSMQDQRIINYIQLNIQLVKGVSLSYVRMFFSSDCLYLIPWKNYEPLVYNLTSNELKEIKYKDDVNIKSYMFFDAQKYNKKIYAFPFLGNQMLCIDTDEKNMDILHYKVEKEELTKNKQKMNFCKNIGIESDGLLLEDLIKHI